MALRAGRTGRWTDRLEDGAAWAMLAAGLLVVLLGGALGTGLHDRLVQQGRAEALDRAPASATLLDNAPTIASAYATGSPVGARAAWHDNSGTTHTGVVTASQGLEAGNTVPIWIDGTGAAVPAPTSSGNALTVAAITAGIVILAGAAVLAALWEVLRRVTLAYNCAAWEQEWRAVAPIWSRGEGKRG